MNEKKKTQVGKIVIHMSNQQVDKWCFGEILQKYLWIINLYLSICSAINSQVLPYLWIIFFTGVYSV